MALLKKFAPTEIQHDFGGTDPGITATHINNSPDFNDDKQLKKSVLATERLEAMTDHALIIAIFGQRINLAIPTTGTFANGIWRKQDYNNNPQAWEIKSANADGPRGAALAAQLGIRNKSVAIIDFDHGIIDKRLKAGPPSDFLLYVCINNITRADSAGKKNVHKKSIAGKLFSSDKGITCKGLLSTETIEVNASGQLRMNYVVTNRKLPGTDIIKQSWEAVDKTGVHPGLHSFEVNDAHEENNRTNLFNALRPLVQGNRLRHPNVLAIQALLKKRSGDYFQGWITKYLLKKIRDDVEVLFYHKPGPNSHYVQFDLDDENIQAMFRNDELGDIFTVTHDYPYLCFCIHVLGVSVLFRSNDKIIYFRRIRE